MAKKKTNYIDNKKFYECIVDYKEAVNRSKKSGLTKPRIPEYAGECIMLIADNLANRYYKFAKYSYREEMKSDAILNCIKYFDNFDVDLFKNPHAYFTQICYYANIQRIKTEKVEQYVKFKHFENSFTSGNDPGVIFSADEGLLPKEMYDNISLYISEFETKEEIKKENRKAKVLEKKLKDSLDRFAVDEDFEDFIEESEEDGREIDRDRDIPTIL